MKRDAFICLSAAFSLLGSSLIAQNAWPQWRGPDRTDLSTESGLLKQWPAKGPSKVWTVNTVGKGYAGPAIVDNMIYILGAEKNTEYLMALNAKDGKEAWRVVVGKLLTNGWGDGPRATPTVKDGKIYVMGGQGDLVCVDAKKGKKEWSTSMVSLGGVVPKWGYTESVLLTDNHVICTPGGGQGAIAALDKKTGKVAWQTKGLNDGAQYSSPVMGNVNGKDQIIQLFMKTLAGVDPSSGKVLWKSDWTGRTAVIPTPVVSDNKVFIATGYGVGCKQVAVSADNSVKDVWVNKNMKNHHGGVILLDDHLYGYSDGQGWVCMSYETGDIVWREKEALGKGAISYADGMFYLLEEGTGNVVLIEANSKGWSEKGRFKLDPQTQQRSPKGKIWVHPVIVNGKMYLRDQEYFICYDVKGRS